MPGLAINGRLVAVPGADVISPRELPWVYLDGRDHKPRAKTAAGEWVWPQQAIYHTTSGAEVKLKLGRQPNPLARAKATADWWHTNPRGKAQSGGAHLIVAGRLIVCLEDLVRVEAYHATKCNPRSVGIEMCQDADGTLYEDTLATAIDLALVLADELGIPLQTTSRVYRASTIIERMKYGGPDVVGFYGHRDCAWMFPEWYEARFGPEEAARKRKAYPNGYADRGRGDPGDEWYAGMRARGAIAFDLDRREDLAYWRDVQAALNARFGARLVVDGVCGQATVRALRKWALWSGVFFERPIP